MQRPVGCLDGADLFKPYCDVGWKSEDEPKQKCMCDLCILGSLPCEHKPSLPVLVK